MFILRSLIGVILLPVCYSAVRGLIEIFLLLSSRARTSGQAPNDLAFFAAGLLTYAVFQIILFKPLSIYVFGHEATHALAGLISGAKIKSFSVKKTGGKVILTKSNLFITLSPYFIPVYSLLIIIIYWGARHFHLLGETGQDYKYFMLVLGISVSFHIFLTVHAIMQGQSDLKVYGTFFSLVFILIINCSVLSLMTCLLFKVNFLVFLGGIPKYTISSVSAISSYAIKLYGNYKNGN